MKKIKLSEYNINTLMLFLQQKIEENAYVADKREKGNLTAPLSYPPNRGLTEMEEYSLKKHKTIQF